MDDRFQDKSIDVSAYAKGDCPTEDALSDFVLRGDDAERVEAHLIGCATCVAVVAEMRLAMQEPDAHVSPLQKQRVWSRVERELRPTTSRRWFAVAAAILLAAFVGWLVQGPDDDSGEKELTPDPIAFKHGGVYLTQGNVNLTAACRADDGTEWLAGGRNVDGSRQSFILHLGLNREVLHSLAIAGIGDHLLNDILPLPDGGFIGVGEWNRDYLSMPDHFVVRVDRDGKMLWNRRFGGEGGEKFYSAALIDNESLVISGRSFARLQRGPQGVEIADTSFPEFELFVTVVCSLSLDGELRWYRAFNSGVATQGRTLLPRPSVFVQDRDIFVSGGALSADRSQSGWIVRLNDSGEVVDQTLLRGAGISNIHSLVRASNGDLVVTGTQGPEAKAKWGWCARLDGMDRVKQSWTVDFASDHEPGGMIPHDDGSVTWIMVGEGELQPERAEIERANVLTMVTISADGSLASAVELRHPELSVRSIRRVYERAGLSFAGTGYVQREINVFGMDDRAMTHHPIELLPSAQRLPIESREIQSVVIEPEVQIMDIDVRGVNIEVTAFSGQ
jgi:hypothetical protein